MFFYSNLKVCDMATGGTPFVDSEEELHNWTVTNSSLDDRLNNTVRDLHRMSPRMIRFSYYKVFIRAFVKVFSCIILYRL